MSHCINLHFTINFTASRSMTASTEADIISDMLKKPFSARQSGEQNIIVTQRPMPKLQSTTGDRSFQESWYTKKDWLCGSFTCLTKKAMFCWPCYAPINVKPQRWGGGGLGICGVRGHMWGTWAFDFLSKFSIKCPTVGQ